MPAFDTADSQFRALLGAAAIVIIVGGLRAVSEPRVMKQGFDLGPFVAFAAVLFWAYVLGPTGALLAIPLTTALRRAVMPATVASAPESTATESTAPALSPA